MRKLDIGVNLENRKINDMSFDWYGERIALIMDFKRIMICNLETRSLECEKEIDINFEYGILKIKWCHPQHGHILAASTSVKSLIIIWKEYDAPQKRKTFSFKEFHDQRENILELKFLPKEKGRKLSVGFYDGSMVIYSIEGMSHGNLTLVKKFFLELGKDPVSCLSWSKEGQDTFFVAVGFNIKVVSSF
jgi:WD40 repeat protein